MPVVTEKLVAFAQKMYNDNLFVADARVFRVDRNESMVIIYDTHGREDRYWVVHHDHEKPETWSWVRNVTTA